MIRVINTDCRRNWYYPLASPSVSAGFALGLPIVINRYGQIPSSIQGEGWHCYVMVPMLFR
jgi:hypothetical protein